MPDDSSLVESAPPGTVVGAYANRPLLLNAPETTWFVQSGKVDIFLVRYAGGQAAGPRRHVLRCRAGDILCGFEHSPEADGYKVICVGSPDSQLIQLDARYLQELDALDQTNLTGTKLLEAWVSSLSLGLARGKAPKSVTLAERGHETRAPKNIPIVAGSSLAWIRQIRGSSSFLGHTSLPPIVAGSFFPLIHETWLVPREDCVVENMETAAYQREDVEWSSLKSFNSIALATLILGLDEADARETSRLQRRHGSDLLRMEKSLLRLTSPLKDEGVVRFIPDRQSTEPLVAACQLAGASIGIEMTGPAGNRESSTSEDPLREIARMSRVRIRRVLLRGRWWKDDHGALIGYVEDGKKPVALIFRAGKGYEVWDPSNGSRTLLDTQASLLIEPTAYSFYRPFPEKQLLWKDLVAFGIEGCQNEIRLVVLAGIAGGLLGLVMPIFTGIIFDTVIPGAQRTQLVELTLLLLLAAVATGMFNMTRELALLRLEGKMGIALQAALWDRLLALPVSFFRNYSAGDLSDRANGIDAIRSALTGSVINTIISGVFSLFNLGLMFYYSWELALVALGLVLIAVAMTIAVGRSQTGVLRDLRATLGKLSGQVMQFLSGISKLRVSGTESRAFSEWTKSYTRQRILTKKAHQIANRFSVFNSVYFVLGPMAIFYSVKEWASPITAGDFLAFNSAFGQLFMASMSMASAAIAAMALVPIFERAMPILECLPEIDGVKTDPGELDGDIEISRAVFRYQADKPPVLEDISFCAHAGEFIAVVGPSGCGKSTLFRLLLGFDTPESGIVYFDGKDMRGLDVQAVRRQMGVVLQNSFPFRGDIYSNIIGSKPCTLEDAWEAARLAGLEQDIKQMPMGMHTVISETTGLSGGQRQRLMIARAIVTKPRIILFDEATSALDNRTQAIVSRSLESLKATRVVIAHRLSTVMNADRILVMDAGRIVQNGTFKDLMGQEGLFADLANRQLS